MKFSHTASEADKTMIPKVGSLNCRQFPPMRAKLIMRSLTDGDGIEGDHNIVR